MSPERIARPRSNALALRAFVMLTAALMAALVAVPVSVWRSAPSGSEYRGFDPNLVATSSQGFAAANPGVIQFSSDTLKITTISSSRPSAQLLTTSVSAFAIDMKVAVQQNPPGSEPLRIGIWSPRSNSGYFIVFGPAPTNSIAADAITDGAPAQTLSGGTVKSQLLGSYVLGEPYHLQVQVDKAASLIRYRLTGESGPPSQDPAMALDGGPHNANYRDIFSAPVPVSGGQRYRFGSLVRLVSGSDAYKISVMWLDKRGGFINYAGDWMSTSQLSGWTKVDEESSAPAQATSARVLLGSGDATSLLFTDAFLVDESRPNANLLTNPNLRAGTTGWTLGPGQGSTPQLVPSNPLTADVSLSPGDAPGLLEQTRLSVTVSASSAGGSSSASLASYRLDLPAATGLAIKTDDPTARFDVVALLLVGIALIAVRLLFVIVDKAASFPRGTPRRQIVDIRLYVRPWHLITLAAVVGAVVISNVLLFGLGSSPFDMASQRIWEYVAVEYGITNVYTLPAVVSVASVWGGVPYQEALFPYQPVMAYLFALEGWVTKLAFAGPTSFTTSSFQLEFVSKAINLLSVLGDGVLIYFILRKWSAPVGKSLLAASLFVVNPAVWFGASVLGANHVLGLVIVLVAIHLAENNRPTGAWIALGLATLTRPQMLVFTLLIGLAFLRRFRVTTSLLAVSWMVVVCFVIMAPLMIQTSPSLPVDVLANTVRVQELGGNDRALTTVSLDVYSVWPLITGLVAGQGGLSRIFFPSDSLLVGALTYQQAGLVITAVVLLAASGLIALQPRTLMAQGSYVPVVALGIVGFLMFLTGLTSTHFILALPFIILCAQRLKPATYLAVVVLWSATTIIAMWGSFGVQLAHANYLGLPLFGSGPGLRSLTNLVSELYSSDRIITAGALANCVVLLVIAGVAFRSRFTKTWVAAPHVLEAVEPQV